MAPETWRRQIELAASPFSSHVSVQNGLFYGVDDKGISGSISHPSGGDVP